jgi:type I restriction enzyme, S subunit
MSEWKTVKLGDVTEIISGYAFKSEDFQAKGIPVIKIANIKNGHVSIEEGNTEYLDPYFIKKINKKFIVEKGDVLISLTGSHLTQPNSVVGRVAQYRYNSVSFLNQRAGKLKIIDSENCINSYLYYFLVTHSMRQEIALLAHGAANQANVSPKDIEKLKVRIPSLNVQKKIAAVLSAYDDLIENTDRRITLLEKMAEEIYREWFVRLRFPGHEQATFHKGIPEGWEIKNSSFYFGYVQGKSYLSHEISDISGNKAFVTLKSINRGGGYRLDGLKYYSGKYKEEQVIYENDVIMAVTDMTQNRDIIGRVARIPKSSNGSVISLDIIKIVPKNISNSFLYSFLRYSGFGSSIKEFANGANVLHLSAKLVVGQKIIIPPEDLRDRYDQIFIPMSREIDNLNDVIFNLKQTRDRLLTRLISGKLSVEDLDIQFPPSMTTDP